MGALTLIASLTTLVAPGVFGAAAPTLSKVYTTAVAARAAVGATWPPLCSFDVKKGDYVCPSTTQTAPGAGATFPPICTFNPVTGKYDCPGDNAKTPVTITADAAAADVQATFPPLCT